jgi:hypothetical protein
VGARRRQEAGPDSAQAVVKDRLAASVALFPDLLEDAHARERRLVFEQLADPRNERVELGGALWSWAIARRLRRGERAPDRVAVDLCGG